MLVVLVKILIKQREVMPSWLQPLLSAIDWTVSLTNSHVKVLNPSCECTWRWGSLADNWVYVRSWRWRLHDGISALIRDTRELALSPSHMRTQREGSHLWNRKGTVIRNWPCWHLDLGLLASRLWEDKFLLFKLPSLWYFVMAAQAGWYT